MHFGNLRAGRPLVISQFAKSKSPVRIEAGAGEIILDPSIGSLQETESELSADAQPRFILLVFEQIPERSSYWNGHAASHDCLDRMTTANTGILQDHFQEQDAAFRTWLLNPAAWAIRAWLRPERCCLSLSSCPARA